MNFGVTELILLAILLLFFVALPVAVIVIVRMFSKQRAMTQCPFCAEAIQPEAKICRYCQRDLP